MRDRSSEYGHIESLTGVDSRQVVPESMPEFAHADLLHVTHGNTLKSGPGPSDASSYAPDFGSQETFDLNADGPPMDGCAQSGLISVGPYSVVILFREV